MLLDDFFHIKTLSGDGENVTATLVLNSAHGILKGHFPGMPIVPGVCMMQMVKETMEKHFQCKLIFKNADQVKFLAVITPPEINEIDLHASCLKEGDNLKVSSELSKDGKVYFKIRELFVISDS